MEPEESGSFNVHNLQDVAINVVNLVCSVFCMPVEMIIRPRYSTRYFPPAVTFLCTILMFFLPLLWMGVNMIPFIGGHPPPGLFDIASFAKIYFLLLLVHGIRTYLRMIHMEKEEFSWSEGPPLPFMHLIPGTSSLWRTRIFIEPAFVFVTASVLNVLGIFQSNLTTYLHFLALTLAMKQITHWYRTWEVRRDWLDQQNLAPLISRLVENTASQEDLAVIHLASFPKTASPELRKAAAIHIAKSYGGDSHE